MKKSIIVGCALLLTGGLSAQTDIANARTYSTGSTITVSGVATNGSELGNIRYMQDGTAGIAGYGSQVSTINRGDSITITGPLIEFSGLLEVSPVATVVNHGQAVIQPQAQILQIVDAGESFESQLMQIDNVTFVETGNFATNNSTYTITDGTNNLDIRINASTNIGGTAIPTTPISIRGLMGQYNTNYQLVPRDLNDIFPYVAPTEEINVKVEGNTVLNGGNHFFGANTTINYTIENFGTNNLDITSVAFSGTNAGDFSTTLTSPTSITGGGSTNFTITYTPSTAGTVTAALVIGNNDSDENPYTINLEGAGIGGLSSEPTGAPSNLTFPTREAYTLSGEYVAGTGAGQYLVLWKNGSAITATDVPVDGQSYQRGDYIGTAKVAYVGAATQFTPRGIIANQNYHFTVFPFNGQQGTENYLTTSPLTGNVTSKGEQIGTYYNSIDKTSSTFITDLKNLVNPHTEITYFLYKLTMMEQFEAKDTTGGDSFVTCALSGENKVFSGSFDWTSTGFSREHTFSHSWMPTYPANGTPEEPEYNDQHNLYPANLADANTPRSNLPLGVVVGTPTQVYLNGKKGSDASGQTVYEPRDEHKGNAARAIMYTSLTYGFNLDGNVNSAKQDQQVLKDWHFADLPDAYEIARNEYIYSIQNNRNPFVDSVDYACYIDFDALAYDINGCAPGGSSASIEENKKHNFVVYPVPSDDVVYVQLNGEEINGYSVIDLQGRTIVSVSDVNEDVLELKKSNIGTGTYLLQIETKLGSVSRRIVLQ